jgi:acetyl-CoA acyltransferase
VRSAVVVDAVRAPTGKRNGALSGWHPVELAAEVLNGLVKRSGIEPAIVDDVIMGCVTQVGAQSFNVARNAVLSAGWPESIPGTSIDRQCGSSQQAIHFAAQGILSGAYDVVIAGGVECMSTVPMFSNAEANLADPFGDQLRDRYADRDSFGMAGLVPQGISAEIIADRFGLTREDLDSFSLESHRRAASARDNGRFDAEIVAVTEKVRDRNHPEAIVFGDLVSADEGIRDTSLEQLAALAPAFLPDGKVTAGNASQISDGAAAVLLMSETRAIELGFHPLARVIEFTVVGSDPVEMLTGPIPATRAILARAGLSLADIDLFEVNEAFASVVLAWAKELSADLERVNVNGGAISLGHPLGASGAKLMSTLTHELVRRSGRFGLQVMCEGGGMANATLVERLG